MSPGKCTLTREQQVFGFSVYFSPNVAGCCTHGLVFKDHSSFPRIPFRKCLLEIVRYICRILGQCPVAVLMCRRQDIEYKWQRCAFGNNKFQQLHSSEIQKKEVIFTKRTRAQKLKFFITPPSFSCRHTCCFSQL